MTLSYATPGMMPPPVQTPPMQYGTASPQSYYPAPSPYYMPAPKPQVTNGSPSISAVKIDVNGATLDAGAQGAGAALAQASGQGMMPMYPGRAQMLCPPPMMMAPPPQPQYMMPPPPPQPQVMAPPPQPAPMVMAPPPQPAVNNINGPQNQVMPQGQILPPPPVVDQANMTTPIQQAPQPQMVQQQPQVQDTAQVAQAAPTPQPTQENVEQQAIQPLVQSIGILAPENGQEASLDEQALAVQTIAQYAKTIQATEEMSKAQPQNPEVIEAKGKVDGLVKPLLIDEKVFKGLTYMAVKDTSGLSGEEKAKADQNKMYGMWTLAMLQKVFRSEMNQELQKQNIPPMAMNEIPGVSHVAEIVKSDPNPEIREAGIVALMEVADKDNPKDKEMMQTILKTASRKDKSKNVKNTAKNALKELKNS